MDRVSSLVLGGLSSVENIINNVLGNQYANVGLKVFLALYAALAAPRLPSYVTPYLDNILVKIVVAFLIVYMANKDAGVALMIAVAFIVTLQAVSHFKLLETGLSSGNPSWLPSANIEGFEGEGEEDDSEEPPLMQTENPNQEQQEEDEAAMQPSQLTDNLDEDVVEPFGYQMNNDFTSAAQFDSAQSNAVPGSDPRGCANAEGHCVQGFGDIDGAGVAGYSSF